MHKEYERVPTIALQWRIAVSEMERAKRVVVVGLSFAPSDVRLAWLIRHGLREFDGSIDLAYVKSREDPIEPSGHALVQRAKSLAPSADVKPNPKGFKAYLEATELLDRWDADWASNA